MKALRGEIAEIVGSFMGQQPHSFMVTVASQKIVELIRQRVNEAAGYPVDNATETISRQDIAEYLA